jgi:hypothetical protein
MLIQLYSNLSLPKMIPTQPGIAPSFSHVQHFVLAFRLPRLHLL